MQKQVATVEPNGQNAMEFSAAEPGDPASPARPAAKFVYAGGSSPLSGYTIKRGVGHGGFGEIYFAVSDAGKEVALKLIRRNLDIELRGIRHCLNLKHPNLLALFDLRQDDRGDTWVVMEYVGGECLEDAVVAHPEGLPAEQAISWFHGIAAGVAYLHDRGIVHRDLKPANIFSEEGVVKVGDYGLSKFISCSRRSGQTESVGTVHYMAPEVANGRYGKEIDIYALGIMLYEMLTGRVPFEGESVGEVLMKHLTARPDVSMLAEPYRSVVARALEKDPAKRFSSVSEMLAALPQPAEVPPGAGRLPPASRPAAGAAGAAGKIPLADTVAKPRPADDEPILRALHDGWSKLHAAWDRADFSTPVKVILLVACMAVLILNSPWLVPLATILVLMYGAYWLVRTLLLSHPAPDKPARPPRHAAATPAMPSHEPPKASPQIPPLPRYGPAYAQTGPGRRRYRTREQALAALVVKTPRQRLTELLGSMLIGVLVAAAMCMVMLLINSYRVEGGFSDPTPGQYAWLLLVSIAGTWAVLIPSKFWEGIRGETTPRRFLMMVLGLAVGALAFCTAEMLLLRGLPRDPPFGTLSWPAAFYGTDGHPLVMAYMACFGTLFLLLRWWLPADPLRPTRLSLWSLMVTVVVALLVAGLWNFPQPWLAMVAGTISVSVQLASPWGNPRKKLPQPNV